MTTSEKGQGAEPAVPLTQICYDVAYRMLPEVVFGDFDQVRGLCEEMPERAAAVFYEFVCEKHGVEPDAEDADRFALHRGQTESGREYFVLEYPVPPPVDYTGMTPERLEREHRKHVLAPHFSAMLPENGDQAVRYFVLGQAPLGGGTTLRSVTAEGVNANLGPGPAPELGALLAAVESHLDQFG